MWACARTLLKPQLLVHFFKRIPVLLKQSGPYVGLENFSLDRAWIAAAKNRYNTFPNEHWFRTTGLYPWMCEHDSGTGTRAIQALKKPDWVPFHGTKERAGSHAKEQSRNSDT